MDSLVMMDHSQPQSQSLKEDDDDDDDVVSRPNASASFDMSLLSSPSPRKASSVLKSQSRVHCGSTTTSNSSIRNKPPYLRPSASWDENEQHYRRSSSRLIHTNTPAKRKLEHHNRKPKRSLETCTTATDSLDGPIGGCGNDNSSTTSSSSDFTHLHFANFPASLPRLAPPLELNHQNQNHHPHHLLLHHSNDLGYSLEDNEDDDDDEDDHEEREDTDEKSSLIMTPSPRTRLNFHSFSPATIPTSSLLPILPPSKTSPTSSSSILALHNHCDATTTATTTSPEALFLDESQMSALDKEDHAHDQVHHQNYHHHRNHHHNDDDTHSTANLTPLREPPGTPTSAPLFALPESPIPEKTEEEQEQDCNDHHHRCMMTTNNTRRRRRPMPDSNAFDEPNPSTSTSTIINNSNSQSHSSSFSMEDIGRGPSTMVVGTTTTPFLCCPPTPVRTPAWAQTFRRSNSLIATKILATCMPRNVELGTSPSSHQQPKSNKCPKQEEDKDLDWLHQTRSHAQSDLPRPGHQEQQHHLHASQDDNEEEELKQQATVATRQQQQEHPVSLADNFQVLSNLGSGTFADVYKVRSKTDGKLYAIKRNRRQFRGKRDREAALTEVRCLQQLQSKTPQSSYVLRFFQAWQEDGYFFCQTELCCRDTCRELIDSVRTNWEMARTRYPCLANNRFFPIPTLFKILHDTVAGLAHIHKHGMTHFDIKPGNIFLVPDDTLGAVCKIGDFGLARTIGNSEDGREGDQKYMALELLQENTRAHPSADIFSLGLTMYEMAHTDVAFFVPAEGPRWHELRNGNVKAKEFIAHPELASAIASMMHPDPNLRPSAEQILYRDDVKTAGNAHNAFLAEYIRDVETFDLARQEQMERIMAMEPTDQQETPRNLVPSSRIFASPPPYKMMTSTMIPSSPPPPPPLWYHHRHPSSSSSPTPAADPVQP